GPLGQCRDLGHGGRVDLLVGHDLVDQTDLVGLVRLHTTPGEDHVLGPGRADQAGQALCTARTGDHAELDLGHTKTCPGPGDPEVGRQRQLQTTTEGITRDRRHDRLGYACHGRDRVLQVACVLTHLHSGAIDHLLDVGARHEHLLPAVEDYGTHRGVLGDLPNRGGDLC